MKTRIAFFTVIFLCLNLLVSCKSKTIVFVTEPKYYYDRIYENFYLQESAWKIIEVVVEGFEGVIGSPGDESYVGKIIEFKDGGVLFDGHFSKIESQLISVWTEEEQIMETQGHGEYGSRAVDFKMLRCPENEFIIDVGGVYTEDGKNEFGATIIGEEYLWLLNGAYYWAKRVK